jgi:hypothetical protein
MSTTVTKRALGEASILGEKASLRRQAVEQHATAPLPWGSSRAKRTRLQKFVHLAECILFSKTASHYSAALMINSETSFGNDNIAT